MKRLCVYFSFLILLSLTLSAQQGNWAIIGNGGGSEYIDQIEVAGGGNNEIYAVGRTNATAVNFNNAPSPYSISGTGQFSFLMKTDSDGQLLWSKTVNDGYSVIRKIAADDVGNVYVMGATSTTVSFSPGGPTITPATMNSKGFIIKYNGNGFLQWIREVPFVTNTMDLSVGPNGEVYAAGVYYAASTLGTFSLPDSAGGAFTRDMFVSRIASNGTVQWVKTIHSIANGPGGAALAVDALEASPTGGLRLAIEYTDLMYLDGDTLQYSPVDSFDFCLNSFDEFGNFEWSQTTVGTGLERAEDIGVSPSGDTYITGYASNNFTFAGLSTQGQFDNLTFLIRVDSAGNGLWLKSAPRLPQSLTVISEDQIYVSGITYQDSVLFCDSTLNFPFEGNGYIARCDSAGDAIWFYDMPINPTIVNAGVYLADNSNDLVCASGHFSPEIKFDVGTLPSQTGFDAFLLSLTDTTFPPPPIVVIPDSVWPGDANDDGIANNFDILTLGQTAGATGPLRPNASLNWIAQAAPDWTQSLPSGVNYHHSDTDGNGIINFDDTLAVFQNYGLMHNRPSQSASSGPNIFTSFLNDSVQVGDTLAFDINLGEDTLPINNFYGVAFSMNFDTSLVDLTSLRVSYDSSWIGERGNDLITFSKNLVNATQTDFAFTRNDLNPVSGFGVIAHATIIMVDDLTAKTPLSEVLTLEISNILRVDSEGNPQPLGTRAAQVVVFEPEVSTGIQLPADLAIRIYPNPASDVLHIDFDKYQAYAWELRDIQGRLLLQEAGMAMQTHIADLPTISGLYLLRVRTEEGEVVQKIQVR
ncbi:MAG: T9SS type A sorting domain-containing protein [Bacteroidota bacterium]